MIKIVVPESVRKIIDTLNSHGFEAYAVGGCVRDSLMGKNPKDWDITTSALPEQVVRLFKKVIETGIQHGTVTVVMDYENFEVTTYRIDGEYKDCRRPDQVFFTENLEADLMRRDFTMNAIAYHPETGCFDPYGGIGDIEKKLIKGVGNADLRFKEDALRMMRAVRFASQTGFAIEKNTEIALFDNVALIAHVSQERIRDEFIKALMGEYMENLEIFNNSRIFSYINESLYGYLEANLKESLNLLKNCVKEPDLRLALLFRNMKEKDLKELLVFMKLDNKSIKHILLLGRSLNIEIKADFYEIRKWAGSTGIQVFSEILALKEILGVDTKEHSRMLNEIIRTGDPLTLKELEIDGSILMKEEICKGKAVGDTLAYLLDKVHFSPELNQGETLLQMAREFNRN